MADAPKILGTDKLYQMYPKVNAAIDNANEALKTSSSAETKSDTAVTTANRAETKANSVQTQFNQVVIEGDSSVEAAQARVKEDGTAFTTLKERLDSSDSQLADLITVNTNNVAEINLTIADSVANNQMVKFKKKVYEIDAPILLPDNVYIDFNRAVIKRKAGSGVFDLVKNADETNGNSEIFIKDLRLDGNKDVDSLIPTTVAHRFSGLKLVKATGCKLENITVTGTVNAEEQGNDPAQNPAAGIFFDQCSDIDCKDLNGYLNDRTAIFVNRSKVKINGSLTYDNLGSGISSANSDESEYHNITTYDNGYSNLSVNGNRSKVSNVLSYGSTYSGVNIGHSGFPSDDTIATNIHSYNNGYEGITIGGSAGVKVLGFEVHGNTRNNLRVFEGATAAKLLAGTSKQSAGGHGILVDTGSDHIIDDVDVFENANSGIFINSGVSGAKIGSNVKSYNNGKVTTANSAGLVLNSAIAVEVMFASFYDNQATKTQESGIWIAAGSDHVLKLPKLSGNKTYDIRKTSSPSNIKQLSEPVLPVTITGINGWTVTGTYTKTSDNVVILELTASGGTPGNACFNLPVGFRPSTLATIATQANGAFAYAEVTTGGDVKPYVSNVSHKIYASFRAI